MLTTILPEILFVLFLAAILAGFLDTLAGGGGLITVPVLLLTGVPMIETLGTNKLQGSMGTLTASYMMIKKRQVKIKDVWSLFICAFIGSVIGTITVLYIDTKALEILIPIVLAIIALYFLLAPKAGEVESIAHIGPVTYRATAVPAIGWYDGFLGPGTGSFFSLAGVALRGQTLLKSTATAKIMNFATNIGSLIIFIFGGKIVWTIGAVMMLGQVIGAWVGAHSMIKGGTKLIRPLIVFMCLAMLTRYAWQQNWLGV